MGEHSLILVAVVEEFRALKRWGEAAMGQVGEEDLHARLNGGQCSIAAYVRHMAGNMQSRWTDLLTTDGEKPWRDREAEFAERPATRAELMAEWEAGWSAVLGALETLEDADLGRTVLIRREPHTVMRAITRQLGHYGWHVGQIVLLSKHFRTGRGEEWQYLTIPPGGSAAFNRAKGM